MLLVLLLLLVCPVLADLPAPIPLKPPGNPLELSEREAVRLALANNPSIRAGLAQLEQALAQAQAVAAPARIQAGLALSRDRQRTPEGPPFVTDLLFVQLPIQSDPLEYSTSRVGLEVRQLLLDGGRIEARIEEAKQLGVQAEENLLATYGSLVRDVRLGYLELLEARDGVTVACRSVELAELQRSLAEARFRAGEAARADTIYARFPKASAELEQTRAEQALALAQAGLNRLLGLPGDTALNLSEPESPKRAPQGFAKCLCLAREQRPERKALVAQVESARFGLRSVELENHPQLQAVGKVFSVGYDEDVFPTSTGWQVGVEVNWPILDGQRRHYLKRAAIARLQETEARLEEFDLALELEVRQAYLNLLSEHQAHLTAEVGLIQAQEALAMAEGQYEVGVTTFLRVNETRLDFLKAQTALSTAYYGYLKALTRLDWACGKGVHS